MTRRERELAKFFPHRTFVQFAIVGRKRGAVAVEKFADRTSRELAMLERARDALAHQRIDTRGITGKDDASASIAVTRVEPSNRERLPSRGVALQAVERKFGKGSDEFRDHPRVFATFFREFV